MKIPNINEEIELIQKGFKNIVGLDEVGRGACAGPLVAGACILNINKIADGIKDSKLLSPKKRGELAVYIKKDAVAWGIGITEVFEIETWGVHKATLKAFERALDALNRQADFLLIDAYRPYDSGIPYKAIKKGDVICMSIAAASIVAKVYRDNLMRKLAEKHTGYFFEQNKGYGTKKHLDALAKLGPCQIHRRNFKPCLSFEKT